MKASSKRRRTKADIQQEKIEEERKQNEIFEKLKRFDQYQSEIKNLEALNEEKESYRKLCHQMFVDGVIK